MENITIERKEKPNSFEFGKSGNRFKIYFDTAEDLQIQIAELKAKGLYNEDA